MEIKNAEDFGEIIRELRKSQHLTQIQLAAVTNVSPRFIGELEKGKPTIQLDKALYVAWMLGANLQAHKKR